MSNILVNQGTQTSIATDSVGTVNYQVIKLDTGGAGASSPFTGTILEVSSVASLPNLPQGSIQVTKGTISTGTINSGTISTIGTLPNLPQGSINVTAGTINAGTINVATISALPNLPQGSINITAGTIATLGTMGTLGQLNNIGTLPNLPGGTINAGTVQISGGTVSINELSGTLNLGTITGNVGISSGTINAGTLNVGTINNGTFVMPSGTLTTMPNIPGGTINILAGGTLGILTNGTLSSAGTVSMINAGTITSVGTIPGVGTLTNIGSITNLGVINNAGTLQAGTINVGTFTLNPLAGVILTTSVSVANGTATALPGTTLSNRKSMFFYNVGTATILYGGSGITGAINAIPVGTGDYSPAIDLGTTILYGICATAGGTAITFEVS